MKNNIILKNRQQINCTYIYTSEKQRTIMSDYDTYGY